MPFEPFIVCLILAEVARVGGDGLGPGTHILLHLNQHGSQLLFVVGLLRDLRRHDDLCLAVYCDLRIVALHKAPFASAIRHDSAFRIREVALRRCLGPGLFRIQHPGRAAPKLPAALLFFLSSLLQFLFGGLLCSLGVLPCLLLQCRFGFGDLLEPALPPRQFAAQFIASHPLACNLSSAASISAACASSFSPSAFSCFSFSSMRP